MITPRVLRLLLLGQRLLPAARAVQHSLHALLRERVARAQLLQETRLLASELPQDAIHQVLLLGVELAVEVQQRSAQVHSVE